MRRVPKPYIPKEIFAALITTLLVETAGLEPAPRVRSRLPIVPIYALPAFQPERPHILIDETVL